MNVKKTIIKNAYEMELPTFSLTMNHELLYHRIFKAMYAIWRIYKYFDVTSWMMSYNMLTQLL